MTDCAAVNASPLIYLSNMPLLGSVGLVLRARRAGLISSAADALLHLRGHGMYLSDHIIRQALALVGESFD